MKTRFNEFYKNTNGKYSGSGFIGFYAGIAAILVFIAGCIASFLHVPDALEIMEKALYMITISAALLGVRKLSKTDKDFKVE
jgi:hypothetical protein